MRTSTSNRRFAFTVIELVAIIVIVTMLFVLLFTGLPRARHQARNKQCIRNLQQVGLAFRQWNNEGDRFPMKYPDIRGGSMESATNGEIFRTFVVMSNELQTPKILICPADTRTPAVNLSPGLANSNVSYFIGIDADETRPQMLLSGDRNLTNGPLPPNRVLLLTTNSAPGWDQQLHKFRGNVGLADGSVQGSDTTHLRAAVTNAGDPTLLAIP